MKIISDKSLNNPLIYIFITFILASFSYELYDRNKLQAIFYVCGFFIFLMLFKGKNTAIILFLFFIVSINNNIYFYSYIPKEVEEVRVTEVNTYYGKGEIKGRVVNLVNIDSNIEVGNKLLVKGQFIENCNKVKGVVGDYKIKEYLVLQSDFIDKLYKKRRYIFEKVQNKLGVRKASLITSVSFGYKNELDEDHRTLMGSLGISHAISVSGLHLVLIYSLLKKILGVKISLGITLIYVLFSGALAPAIRAYIMIVIMNIGKVVKRNYNPLAAISLSGIILLLMKPYYIYNLGFILSFLATLGIILFNKRINKSMYKLPNFIRGTIAISISAQVLTLPVIILYFNEVSLNFIIGNIIVIPFINILVALGNILIFIVDIPVLFNYIMYLCHYIIKYIDIIMYKIESISLDLLYFNYTIAYFYISILIAYYFFKKGFKKFIYFPILMGVYILVLIYSPFPRIRYYTEGAISIRYKGEGVIIKTKDIVDEEKLMAITLSDKIIENVTEVTIGENIKLKECGENFILQTKNSQYLLFVNYEKSDYEYDIIDFRKGDIREVTVFNNTIINN